MKLVIISGRSGSGKTLALRTLEDQGYYCVDNLPTGLLHQLLNNIGKGYSHVAVGIDVRSIDVTLSNFRTLLDEISTSGWEVETLFFDADNATLLKRFSETRRRHPLTHSGISLQQRS